MSAKSEEKKIKKEQAKKEKLIKQVTEKYNRQIEQMNEDWYHYNIEKEVPTNIAISDSDAGVILRNSNVFIGLNYQTWSFLNPSQKMYCLQMHIDNVCEELKMDRVKIGLCLGDLYEKDLKIKFEDNQIVFDVRLLNTNFDSMKIAYQIINLLIEEKRINDIAKIFHRNGKDVTQYSSLYDMETVVCPTTEICVLLPRFQEENKHFLNILRGLNRMCLFVSDYEDEELGKYISNFEEICSEEYKQTVKKYYRLDKLGDRELEKALKLYLSKAFIQSQSKDYYGYVPNIQSTKDDKDLR